MKSQGIIAVGVTILALFGLCEPGRSVEGMVSYWRFEEGSGTTAYDSMGGNDGTLIRGASFATGIVGGALSLDGIDDYVTVPDSGSLDVTENITAEAWIKLDDDTKQFSIIEKGGAWNTTKDLSWLFDMNIPWPYPIPSGKLRVVISNAGDAADLIIRSNSIITTGAWHYVAWTYDGSTVNIYADGLLDTSISYTGGIYANNVDLCIGSRMCTNPNTPRYLDGLIDEVAIYNRALTSEEIEQHYQNGLNGVGYLAIEVGIDIKPGSDPNPINPGSKGLVPVAILSSDDFDATHVDPTRVVLAGASVAVRGKGKPMAHKEDVNGDGLTDLVVQVETQSSADLGDGGTVKLTGTTFGGQDIVGYDEIVIVPPEE